MKNKNRQTDSFFFRRKGGNNHRTTKDQAMIGTVGPGARAIVLEYRFSEPLEIKVNNLGNCPLAFFPAISPSAPMPSNAFKVEPDNSQKIIIEESHNGNSCFIMAYNPSEEEIGWYEMSEV